ncbi:hypothetical protein GE09DRAFT_258602 [Coniochaeta sp. 2T2.1]|nr:hypothetical protein GE09DRAFT_258602 [Coniochaeta sp. 2T2.1]
MAPRLPMRLPLLHHLLINRAPKTTTTASAAIKHIPTGALPPPVRPNYGYRYIHTTKPAMTMTTDDSQQQSGMTTPVFSKDVADVDALSRKVEPLLTQNGGRWTLANGGEALEREFRFKGFGKCWVGQSFFSCCWGRWLFTAPFLIRCLWSHIAELLAPLAFLVAAYSTSECWLPRTLPDPHGPTYLHLLPRSVARGFQEPIKRKPPNPSSTPPRKASTSNAPADPAYVGAQRYPTTVLSHTPTDPSLPLFLNLRPHHGDYLLNQPCRATRKASQHDLRSLRAGAKHTKDGGVRTRIRICVYAYLGAG